MALAASRRGGAADPGARLLASPRLRGLIFRRLAELAGLGLALLGLAWRESISGWHLFPRAIFLPLFSPLLSVGFALWFPLALRLPLGRGVGAWMVQRLSALSYSLYLTHLTILEMVGYAVQLHRLSPPWAVAGALGAIIGVSWLTWRLIEQPFIALRPEQRAISAPHAKNAAEPV